MDNTVLVALISFLGTIIGTGGGILASGKLTAFRLKRLETKLDLQSKSVAKIPVIEEKIQGINRRIILLEKDTSCYLDLN